MSDSDDEIENPQITPQSKPLEPASVMDFDLDLEASCSWPLDQIGFSSSSNPMSPFLISATSDHQPSSPLWVFSDVDDDRQAKLAALEGWNHIDCLQETQLASLADDVLKKLTIYNETKEAISNNDVNDTKNAAYASHSYESAEDFCPASDEEEEEEEDDEPKPKLQKIEHQWTDFSMNDFIGDENNEGRVTYLFKKVSGSVV